MSLLDQDLQDQDQDQDLLHRHQHKQSSSRGPSSLRPEIRTSLRSRLALPPTVCQDVVVQNALYTGDQAALKRIFPRGSSADLVIQPRGGDMRWVARGEGLWSLTYEQTLTTPLHITAGRGFCECVQLLLRRGADVDLAPDGFTALHEACDNCQSESSKMLLLHGAKANSVSEDGRSPLHMCCRHESLRCSEYLLQYGAAINGRTLDEDDTPLHVAARHGLVGHVDLYLRFGAAVDPKNREGLTPLNAACSQPAAPQDLQRFFHVCQTLLVAGADPRTADTDQRTPLHMACKNVNADVVELLLANGANVNDMDYGGEAPLHNVLKVVCFKVNHQPERVVRALLNHGSIRVWPGALPLVLKLCSEAPPTLEVLLNTYARLKVDHHWRAAVSPQVMKEHQDFYESVFSLGASPRALQHLARCSLRTFLDARVHSVVPHLHLPARLKNYLLLDTRGQVH